MIIGDRLRALREDKKLSQGDIEKRTGLLRCYVSRVENGHTVPAVETRLAFQMSQVLKVQQAKWVQKDCKVY
jgi:transcriptional regulator with XRE-family HTH domain